MKNTDINKVYLCIGLYNFVHRESIARKHVEYHLQDGFNRFIGRLLMGLIFLKHYLASINHRCKEDQRWTNSELFD